LLYGRTGALNLAQIGRELAGGPTDGLVVVSFVLIASGLCVKAALVPFHFWLADAHAVAPTPVCVIFSGVMVELGIYGVARVYWTIYANPSGLQPAAVGAIFITAGTASALIGAVMCAAQRHIKRLLAFSTISHMGILLIALGLMTPDALAGGAIYVLGHGLVKGALFLVAGVLLHRAGTVDEFELRGMGKSLPVTGVAFLLAGLGLAGMPPFGTALGKSLIEGSARHSGRGWISLVLIATSALTAGAVLRVAGRVFLGWGPRQGDREGIQGKDDRESRQGGGRIPWVMLGPIIVLVLAALISGLPPRLAEGAIAAAGRFTDTSSYQSTVLDTRFNAPIFAVRPSPKQDGLMSGLIAACCAVTVALSSLFADRVPRFLREGASRAVRPALTSLRALHSGVVGDYVTWLTLGVAVFGIVLALRTGLVRF
jgi:multicomponent Na+:H+ antiporter subunit D